MLKKSEYLNRSAVGEDHWKISLWCILPNTKKILLMLFTYNITHKAFKLVHRKAQIFALLLNVNLDVNLFLNYNPLNMVSSRMKSVKTQPILLSLTFSPITSEKVLKYLNSKDVFGLSKWIFKFFSIFPDFYYVGWFYYWCFKDFFICTARNSLLFGLYYLAVLRADSRQSTRAASWKCNWL